MDKKYEMEDEEAFDNYHTKLIINNARLYNTEEKKQLNVNLQDIINIKTEFFTYSSNNEQNFENKKYLPENQILEVSSDEEDIIDKYNKIICYNEEERTRREHTPNTKQRKNNRRQLNLNHSEGFNVIKQDSDISDHFSNISPLVSNSKNKRNKIMKALHQDEENGKNYISRHDSFTLPRTTSKMKLYKMNEI